MKKLVLILIFILLLIVTVEATIQLPDLINYNNENLYLSVDLSYPSPLEIYFLSKYGSSPFTMLSTGNYRGFTASWEIDKNELFLSKINIENDEINLKIIFKENVINNKVKAYWFSGNLLLASYNNSDESKYFILEIEKGNIIKLDTININDKKNEIMQLPDNYKKYIESIEYGNNKNKIKPLKNNSDKKEYHNISLAIKKINDNRNEIIQKNKKLEKEKKFQECSEIYTKLNGYMDFTKKFSIEDASIGNFNSMPYSAYIYLKSKKNYLIDSIIWWNPIINNNANSSWIELLNYYEEALKKISKHQWIKKWKDSDSANSIEIWVLGHSIGQIKSDYYNFTLTAWNHANLQGKPEYFFVLRSKNNWFAEIFLNDESNQSLITFITEVPKKNNSHWLYDFNFSFHPAQEIPEYIIINKNGEWIKNKNKILKPHVWANEK